MKQGGLPSSPFAAERRERLRQQTGQAVQRLSHPVERPGTTAQPGDLLVLPTCEAALWWLVLKAQDQTVTLIPGDDRVWAGISDLRVPADFFPGLLTLRCAFLTEADANSPALADAQCVGQLPAALLRQATEMYEAFESGTLEPSPRQEDDDFDPFYQDWIQEQIRPALAVLAAPAVGSGSRRGGGGKVVDLERRRTPTSPVWLRSLAAVLTVALVGAGWGWSGAQRELGRVRVLAPVGVNLSFSRGDDSEIEALSYGKEYVLLRLQPPISSPVTSDQVRVEIRDPQGQVLWTGTGQDLLAAEPVFITMPTARLRPGAEILITAPDPETGELTVTRRPIRLVEEAKPGN